MLVVTRDEWWYLSIIFFRKREKGKEKEVPGRLLLNFYYQFIIFLINLITLV